MKTKQRVVLITGGNRGLGFETARQMKALGYRVILASRDGGKGESAARELGCESIALDVVNGKEVESLAAHIRNRTGRIDALVNNAAILIDEGRSLLDLPADDLRFALETNSIAPLMIARAALPMMSAQGYGRIVNVSSSMGQYDSICDDSPSYRLSKLLLNGVTRILADAVKAENVLVNAVDPGWVRTDMGGRNAPRSLEEGAKGIVWAATLPDGGPHGGFFRDGERIAW